MFAIINDIEFENIEPGLGESELNRAFNAIINNADL